MAPRNNRRAARPKQKLLTRQQFTSMLNARREMKYFTDNDETTVPVDGVIGPMTQGIITGDTADARDGNQISVSKLDINLTLLLNSAVTVDTVRFIVFADMQANSVYPIVGNLLVAADPNASLTREVRVTRRFRILHDVLLPLSIAGNSRILVHRKSLKLSNHVVTYSGTTNVEASNSRGALYYLICGDLSANFTAYNFDYAFSFYDS